mgnify:CR=1 FL=1
MKKRLLQIVSAFIMIAMIIPMMGANVKAASKAQDLFNYIFANGMDITLPGEDAGNTFSISQMSEDNADFIMVYGHKNANDIWLSYSHDVKDANSSSLFFTYDIATDSINSCLISFEDPDYINNDKITLLSASLSKDYEPGSSIEYHAIDELVPYDAAGVNSLANEAMTKINAFLNTNGFSLADLGFTSQKFGGSGVPSTPSTPATPATPTPTSAPLPSFDPNATGDTGVSGFVDRLYTVVLGRAAEKDGKKYWADELASRKQDGATAAFGFLTSQEFADKHYDDKSFVEILYRLFFGRNSDKDGMAYWKGELENGQSRDWVISGFVNSTEWANICVEYGIKSGGTGVPTTNIKPNKKVTDFASRLYTTCLGRDAEKAGLEYWAGELANMRVTGTTAAQGFFFSKEFIDAKLSDKEFVNRLYKTFMGREADKAGFDYWLGEMKNGSTRETVFMGFATAPEFANLCNEAGIINN